MKRKKKLNRRITGMYGNSDPNDWSIELNEGVAPLCIEAADEIERLETALAKAREGALEEAAKIAELHFIPNHSVAGVGFADICARKIRALKEKP